MVICKIYMYAKINGWISKVYLGVLTGREASMTSSWHADPSSICARTFLGTPIRMTIGGRIIHCREVVHRSLGVRLDGFSTLSPAQRADLSMFLLQKMK